MITLGGLANAKLQRTSSPQSILRPKPNELLTLSMCAVRILLERAGGGYQSTGRGKGGVATRGEGGPVRRKLDLRGQIT